MQGWWRRARTGLQGSLFEISETIIVDVRGGSYFLGKETPYAMWGRCLFSMQDEEPLRSARSLLSRLLWLPVHYCCMAVENCLHLFPWKCACLERHVSVFACTYHRCPSNTSFESELSAASLGHFALLRSCWNLPASNRLS